jgi:toxin CptA
MRIAPIVSVTLAPSRMAGAAIGVGGLGTLAVLLLLPLSGGLQAAACAVVLAGAWVAFERVAARATADAVVALRATGDLTIVVTRGDGRLVAGRVRPSTFVTSLLTSIVWRAEGACFARSILVLPDMLDADDFRRLRVLLRYARSGRTQDAPASHA